MDLNETNYHVRCCDCVWHYSWDEKEDVMEETAKHVVETGHWVMQGVSVTGWVGPVGGPIEQRNPCT